MAPHKKGFMALTANPLVARKTTAERKRPPRNTMTKISFYCPTQQSYQTSFCIKTTQKKTGHNTID